jgi:hypothetical protein
LERFVKNMGYTWRKCQSKRKIPLPEQPFLTDKIGGVPYFILVNHGMTVT